MFFIAAILAFAAAMFYAASVNTTGWAVQLCRHGDVFCGHPSWLLIGAVLSLIWAFFLRVDRL
ncbi:hypothetical protein [Tardiphaga sp.]|uniref:hypothetical protein n=1 Tax=Tardiphaga sp. TaxID=1926292 RepID=UPI002632A92A|nr:hypothetical protein [Tardiphaga sp.]MDB5616626.1 hypothetical protein [Tardiphaga sp.]